MVAEEYLTAVVRYLWMQMKSHDWWKTNVFVSFLDSGWFILGWSAAQSFYRMGKY